MHTYPIRYVCMVYVYVYVYVYMVYHIYIYIYIYIYMCLFVCLLITVIKVFSTFLCIRICCPELEDVSSCVVVSRGQ